MAAWWDAMSMVEQIFAVVGICATVLLVIQVILLLVGFGSDSGSDAGGDADVDADTGGLDVGDAADADFSVDADTGDIGIDTGPPPEISIDVGGGQMVDVEVHPGDWYGQGDGLYHADIAEAGAGGLRLFTMQGLIAFFAVFGWSGLVMLKSGLPTAACVALAVVFGFVAMVVIAMIFRAMLKLQQEGTMDIRNALGKSGTVYMRIPAQRVNKGKVSVLIQGQLVELDAVTDEEQMINTGAEVTVVGISNNNALIVRTK